MIEDDDERIENGMSYKSRKGEGDGKYKFTKQQSKQKRDKMEVTSMHTS